jgi:radical SAM superfamily enzyme YgiQ (UPF0313 family)
MTAEHLTLVSTPLAEDGKFEPPLGPLYIAAVLEQEGVEVDFRDFQLQEGANGFSGDALAEFTAGHGDLVAFSCFVDMLPAVVDAARILHQQRPETRILLGGPGPTAAARRLLEAYPWIHGVVQGEGEETAVEWLRMTRGERRGAIDGMVYRDGDELLEGAPRARNLAVDRLPHPAYHLLESGRYTSGHVITTRGCAYRCSFCDVTALWNNRTVYRSLESTIDEIEMLRDRYGQSHIAIVDDTFVLNRKRVRAFCELLLERRSAIEWGCFGRINLMSPELVELMARAGCKAVFYGIDSGSPEVLKKTLKVMKSEDILPVLEYSAQYFENIEASFIWGYPFETLDDFQRTVEIAGEASMLAPKVNVQMHMLSPLPNSPMYREFEGELLPPEPEDKDWLLLPAVLLDERAERVRRMVRERPELYSGFYTFPTPSKAAKREILQHTMRALDRTIGRTFFEPESARLLAGDDRGLEERLLAEPGRDLADRIGVGLALGFFRRIRSRDEKRTPVAFDGSRGPRLVRERMEPAPG